MDSSDLEDVSAILPIIFINLVTALNILWNLCENKIDKKWVIGIDQFRFYASVICIVTNNLKIDWTLM